MVTTTFDVLTDCGQTHRLRCAINTDMRTSISVQRELQDMCNHIFSDRRRVVSFRVVGVK